MTTTSNVGNSGVASLGLDPSAETKRGRTELGQQEFFELMVAQLKHQDPLKPLESNEFLGQVAQFTTVRGIQDMQKSFADLATSLGSSQALQASTLVGREVLVPSGQGYLGEQGMLEGVATLPESTRGLGLTVYGPNGQVVRQMSLGPQAAGEVPFQWDGLTDAGQRVAPGVYSVAAMVDVDGKKLAVETALAARVESVTLGRGGASMQLNLTGLGAVGLASVREIL
jgi:flagellar basal-body rod modification protein FlgD